MKYYIHFTHSYLPFRIPELNSLLELNGLKPSECYDMSTYKEEYPYILIDLPNDEIAKAVASRSVLIKYICEFWFHAESISSLKEQVISNSMNWFTKYINDETTWKIDIDSFGKTISNDEQRKIISSFMDGVSLPGQIRMKDPSITLTLSFNYGHIGDDLVDLYFGRFISTGHRTINKDFDLKKRKYIGPTSTCAELAFLMSNQVLSRKNSVMWDCFSGTGSLLVAATVHGAHCFGTDIDVRVLKGIKRGKRAESVRTNFEQYGLRYPELVRADLSALPFRIDNFIDGILCDPPYGIRAGARKTCSKARENAPKNVGEGHIPRTEVYNPDDVIVDLLDVAARMLVVGGRLAYLLPTYGEHLEREVPEHPCLEFISNSEEKLQTNVSRRLITMRKKCEYDASKQEEYKKFSRESIVRNNVSYANLKEMIMTKKQKVEE